MRKHLVVGLVLLLLPLIAYAQNPRNELAVHRQYERRAATHTATFLPDGSVLVAGGFTGFDLNNAANTAEIYDPTTATWRFTGKLHSARGGHTATLLPNGKVLVVGGMNGFAVTNTAELYDPISRTWSSTSKLHWPRAAHIATLLPSGKVLVTGGIAQPSDVLQTAEAYDPETGLWTTTGDMNTARWLHSATPQPTGEVLVAGGLKGGFPSLNSAELYDPAAGTWSMTSDANSRSFFAALLLPNGKVLVTEGEKAQSEVYDPAMRSWTLTGKALAFREQSYTATLLSKGTVLVAGGTVEGGSSVHLTSAELFGPGGSETIGIAFQPVAVQAGASFFAAFSGADVTPETWFDVRFRSPGRTADEVALNWHRGAVALHSLGAGTDAGTYTITGVRKHIEEDDHTSDFTSVSATVTVVLP